MDSTIRGPGQRLWLIGLLPLLLIACCMGAFVEPAVPAVLGHLSLVLAGNQTTATITAIQPCDGGLTIAATSGNGFTYSSGSTNGAVNVNVSYSDSHGEARQGQTTTCTFLPAEISVGQTIAVDYRDDAPATILLAKDRGAYQGILTFAGIALAFIIGLIFLIVRAWRAKPLPTFAPASNAAVLYVWPYAFPHRNTKHDSALSRAGHRTRELSHPRDSSQRSANAIAPASLIH